MVDNYELLLNLEDERIQLLGPQYPRSYLNKFILELDLKPANLNYAVPIESKLIYLVFLEYIKNTPANPALMNDKFFFMYLSCKLEGVLIYANGKRTHATTHRCKLINPLANKFFIMLRKLKDTPGFSEMYKNFKCNTRLRGNEHDDE